MLRKLYKKSRLGFALTWIAAYCILLSLGDSLSALLGVEKAVTLPVALLLSAILFLFLKKNALLKENGLRPAAAPARELLWYLPLLLLLSANLWFGICLSKDLWETGLYILTMLLVGFLEEVIFRGLLFNAMRKDNPKTAVIVSSLTFGIGHIINLVNGSGAELLPNLLQVVYATAAGFLFVMIYCKTDSLVVPILTHGVFNALSAFSVDAPTPAMQTLSALLLTGISGGYGLYLAFTMKKEAKNR